MIRGIERRKIFNDDKDRENFVERLSTLLSQPQGTITVDFDLLSLPLYMVEELPRIFEYRAEAEQSQPV
jgi:hypothetical protein